MEDPVSVLFRWLATFTGWIIGSIILGIRKLLFTAITTSNSSSPTQSKPILDENARQAKCREIVLAYANHLGYIARQVISREELEQKIDSGIDPDALTAEIQSRIDACPGIVLGKQTYTGYEIKWPYAYRSRHAYLIGRSGSGKTNTIRNMIMQDIANGCGVGVLAPEQEMLTEEILPYIPEERMDDVVYVNPADMEFPIPINPFIWRRGGTLINPLMTSSPFLAVSPMTFLTRMREILYHTAYGLLERKNSTLLDVEILLDRNDPSVRDEVIAITDNPRTARFFKSVFPTLPRDACLPVCTRIGQLISPRRVRTLLCQPGVTFDFRQAMDEGKILLFNLSDGILGEQTAQLLGQVIISKIQLAVMSRANIPAPERRPFYLYLDEFQTFTGVARTSYEKILSRARKYNLGLCLAHQQTGQIPNSLLQEILGNVSTLLAFNLSSADAEKFSKEFVLGGMERLPPEALLELKVGEAWGKIGRTVFPLHTPLADQNPDRSRAKEIIERSRLSYGLLVTQEDAQQHQRENLKSTPQSERKFVVVPDEDALDATKVF